MIKVSPILVRKKKLAELAQKYDHLKAKSYHDYSPEQITALLKKSQSET